MNERELAYKLAVELNIPKWQVDEAIEKHGAERTLEQLKKEKESTKVAQ